AAESDPRDLVAPDQALLVAALAEVRDPGLPPAGLLLRLRAVRARVRARAGRVPDRDQGDGLRRHGGRGRARSAAAALRAPVHSLCDVVRHGEQQGAPLELEAELAQAAPVDDLDGTVALASTNHAEIEEPARQGRAQPSGDVQLSLAPVETATHDGTPFSLELGEVDPERVTAGPRLRAEHVIAVPADDDLLPLESGREGHPESAGEMVVARARGANQVAPSRLAQRPHRRLRGDPGQRFDGVRNTVVGEAVITVPPVLARDEEPTFDEAGKVLARGRG